jgi:hypothetical protein
MAFVMALRRVGAFALILFSIACATSAQRQLPSDQPENPPQEQQAAPDNRGTEQTPFIVKELPRDPTAEERKEAQEKSELDRKLTAYTSDLAAYTEWLFFATCGLALLTGALAFAAFFQIVTGKAAIQAAIDSAKATANLAKAATDHAGHAERLARISDETAKRQLRAYILGNGGSVQVTGTSGHSFPKSAMRPPANIEVTVTFKIKNFGSTPAYDFTVWRSVHLWDVNEPQFGTSVDTIVSVAPTPPCDRRR